MTISVRVLVGILIFSVVSLIAAQKLLAQDEDLVDGPIKTISPKDLHKKKPLKKPKIKTETPGNDTDKVPMNEVEPPNSHKPEIETD